MKYSKLFGKTSNTPPRDEITINAQLLVQAGIINKLMAGVYSYLPLGLRVIRNIEQVIREEMNAIGGQEVFLPALHPAENWKKTGGWESIDVLFKIKSRTGKDYALGQSHEEIITPLVQRYAYSYKDLPLALYQIQQKYRDELRSKSGILRGREFNMKDMYSWHENQEDFQKFYEEVKKAYVKAYNRCGLDVKVTEASGGKFSEKISYEFMVLTDAGEDDVLYCDSCEYCINVEIAKTKESDTCKKCNKGHLKKARASEVGNVFDLGKKYCTDFDLELTGEDGKKFKPVMGCYGFGISRLMGVIVEKLHDKKGIIWPKNVAPYHAHLITLGNKHNERAERLVSKLEANGIDVLWDDREGVSAGQKFTDADLIGIPFRLVISDKTGDNIELKKRNKQEAKVLSMDKLLKQLL